MDGLNCRVYGFELKAPSGVMRRYAILDSTRDMTKDDILSIILAERKDFCHSEYGITINPTSIKTRIYTIDEMNSENMSGCNILVY